MANGRRKPGILASEIIKIWNVLYPCRDTSAIPATDLSIRQLCAALDDYAQAGAVQSMRELAGNVAPWLTESQREELIQHRLKHYDFWTTPEKIKELAEMFQMSPEFRSENGFRAIRPVTPDGKAFDDVAMKAALRVRKRIWQANKRRDEAAQREAIAAEQNAKAAAFPNLGPRDMLFYDKMTLVLRSSTIIAKAVMRSHKFHGTKNISSVRKALARSAINKLLPAGLIELEERKGENGQPLFFFRRKP